MKALPVGISTLKTIIDNEMVYIDKSMYAFEMARLPARYFLARPRRFGKSLLVDTFKELFEGNERLFRGLYVHDRWDWSRTYPVFKVDFAGGILHSSEDLENKLIPVFQRYAARNGFTLKTRGLSNLFYELVTGIYEKQRKPVVLLVDEYDKPLLDNIEYTQQALEMRDALKNLYSPIKELDGMLKFVFLTGVSKFSKVNIFSGINNLEDITLDERYATICGYTQGDLETAFAEHLEGVELEKLRSWYNGYNFLGESVYNPFDILLFIHKNRQFRNYWFETGTPGFLVSLFRKHRYFLPELETLEVGEELLSSFELETLEPVTLLFQTGYLTIQNTYYHGDEFRYKLRYPNVEVKTALHRNIIPQYTLLQQERTVYSDPAYNALEDGDLPGLEAAVRRLFAGIPWRNFTNNELIDSEGYYASVLYAFFASMNCEIIPEDITNHGQADLTVRLGDKIYVMEVKVVSVSAYADIESQAVADADIEENSALRQIRKRGYAEKYTGIPGKKVFEVGMIFSRTERNLLQFGYTEAEK